jgi:gliding motility-associated-like protein
MNFVKLMAIKQHLLCFILGVSMITASVAQKIIDPCFTSVKELGFFYGSEDVVNLCGCSMSYISSDMVQWNGTAWLGSLDHANVDIAPPAGCNQRAIWMGGDVWTGEGEGIGLRLDKPLEINKKVSFTFTYASNGAYSDGMYSPMIYTYAEKPTTKKYATYHYVGNLPPANGWQTDSITFTVTSQQAGDTWLILRTKGSSGIVLGNCDFSSLKINGFLPDEEFFCIGQNIQLKAPKEKYYTYAWNTGDKTSLITVNNPGIYSVTISNANCSVSDSVSIAFADCEVRLVMPSVFTPNGDSFNERFIPLDFNYLEKGSISVYNRWGTEVFTGDLFTGWDGRAYDSEATAGVYFYRVTYTDKNGHTNSIQGHVTLAL